MKCNCMTSIDALRYAAENELTTSDFYTERIRTLKITEASEIFKGLAIEEQHHFKTIVNLLRQAETYDEAVSISFPHTIKPKEWIEEIFNKFKNGKLPLLPDKANAREALLFALEIEKRSFDLYSRATENAEDNGTKAVYRFLAGEENKHYYMINYAIDFIDDPERCLYKQGNLLFRRDRYIKTGISF